MVEFDPRKVSYWQLLQIFWSSHHPTYEIFSRQYRNAIFYRSEEQRIQAEQSRKEVFRIKTRPIYTTIEKAGDFYSAEDYHQKYYLRRLDKLSREFQQIYPENDQFVASTAVARVNGYLGCYGQPEELSRDIGLFGLSPNAQTYLIDYVTTKCTSFKGMTCPAPHKP